MRRIVLLTLLFAATALTAFALGVMAESSRLSPLRDWAKFTIECIEGGGVVLKHGPEPYCVFPKHRDA